MYHGSLMHSLANPERSQASDATGDIAGDIVGPKTKPARTATMANHESRAQLAHSV